MLYDKRWDNEVKVETWRQVLLDAADLLDKRGWCQQRMENSVGQLCAFGAIREAAMGFSIIAWQETLDEAEAKMRVALGGKPIPQWNDEYLMSRRNVTATLRRVASE